MSLWVDKYRPTTLAKLDYHLEQAEDLKNMVITIIILRYFDTLLS